MIGLRKKAILFGALALSLGAGGCSADVDPEPSSEHALADTSKQCGDFDGNGSIEYADWEVLCTGTLPASNSAEELARRDFDQDGDFDAEDCDAFWQWWLDKGYAGASPPCANP